jgi:hypothetical protein
MPTTRGVSTGSTCAPTRDFRSAGKLEVLSSLAAFACATGSDFQVLRVSPTWLIDEPIGIERDHLAIGDGVQAGLVPGALPETTVFPGRQAELLFAPLEAVPFPSTRASRHDESRTTARSRSCEGESSTPTMPTPRRATATTGRPRRPRRVRTSPVNWRRSWLRRTGHRYWAQVALTVGAASRTDLDDRVRQLRREYAPIALHRPKDVQLDVCSGSRPLADRAAGPR